MQETTTEAQLLTAHEVAKKLRTTTWSVRRLVESGRLRAFRLSKHGSYRIVAEDVERLMRGEEAPGP